MKANLILHKNKLILSLATPSYHAYLPAAASWLLRDLAAILAAILTVKNVIDFYKYFEQISLFVTGY